LVAKNLISSSVPQIFTRKVIVETVPSETNLQYNDNKDNAISVDSEWNYRDIFVNIL